MLNKSWLMFWQKMQTEFKGRWGSVVKRWKVFFNYWKMFSTLPLVAVLITMVNINVINIPLYAVSKDGIFIIVHIWGNCHELTLKHSRVQHCWHEQSKANWSATSEACGWLLVTALIIFLFHSMKGECMDKTMHGNKFNSEFIVWKWWGLGQHQYILQWPCRYYSS